MIVENTEINIITLINFTIFYCLFQVKLCCCHIKCVYRQQNTKYTTIQTRFKVVFGNNNVRIDWQFQWLRIWLLRVYIESTSKRLEFSQRWKFSLAHAISKLHKRPAGRRSTSCSAARTRERRVATASASPHPRPRCLGCRPHNSDYWGNRRRPRPCPRRGPRCK